MMHRVTRSAPCPATNEHCYSRAWSVFVGGKCIGITFEYCWWHTGVIYRNLPDLEAAWDEYQAAQRARKERLR